MASNTVSYRKGVHPYNRSLVAINIFGFLLSAYAHHVSAAKKSEADYQAFCDISESMSCSRVLTSSYSTGFGILGKFVGETSVLNLTNSVIGMLHYSLLGILSFSNSKSAIQLHLVLAILSIIGTVYLAFILFAVLRDICLVCSLTYIVNVVNLLLVYKKLKSQNIGLQKKKE